MVVKYGSNDLKISIFWLCLMSTIYVTLLVFDRNDASATLKCVARVSDKIDSSLEGRISQPPTHGPPIC